MKFVNGFIVILVVCSNSSRMCGLSLPWQGLSEGKDKEEYNKLLYKEKFETSFEVMLLLALVFQQHMVK